MFLLDEFFISQNPLSMNLFITAAASMQDEKGANLSHKNDIRKTRLKFIEFDDVNHSKLAKDISYFGEKNSKERVLVFEFEYCLGCCLRLLNGKPIMTRGILEEEFERLVTKAKNNQYTISEQTTLQHTDFETFERLIKSAMEFGKLAENQKLNLHP